MVYGYHSSQRRSRVLNLAALHRWMLHHTVPARVWGGRPCTAAAPAALAPCTSPPCRTSKVPDTASTVRLSLCRAVQDPSNDPLWDPLDSPKHSKCQDMQPLLPKTSMCSLPIFHHQHTTDL